MTDLGHIFDGHLFQPLNKIQESIFFDLKFKLKSPLDSYLNSIGLVALGYGFAWFLIKKHAHQCLMKPLVPLAGLGDWKRYNK